MPPITTEGERAMTAPFGFAADYFGFLIHIKNETRQRELPGID